MNSKVNFGLVAAIAILSLATHDALAGTTAQRNLPSECKAPDSQCGCPSGSEVSADCIKVNIDLGSTTPWSQSMDCSLKVFADNDSPSIFTADSLYSVLGGYTFKRVGPQNLSDGITPAEVVLTHPNGEPVHFVFNDGESIARSWSACQDGRAPYDGRCRGLGRDE